MGWDGSGNFTRSHDWTDDEAAGVNIEASRMDTEDDNFETGINACLAKNGENAMTGALDLDGQNLILDADADTVLDAGTDDLVSLKVGGTSGVLRVNSAQLYGSAVAATLRGHIGGLLLSNNSSDAAHDIDIAPGVCASSAANNVLLLSASLTKQLDALWVAGSAAGGLDAGTITARTTYYVWLIKDSTSGTVDACFSASTSASTVLANIQARTGGANYNLAQLIGAVITDSTPAIIAFQHSGDYFRLTGDVHNEVTDSTMVDGAKETVTTNVPADCLGHFYCSLQNATSTDSFGQMVIRYPGANDALGFEESVIAGSFGGSTFDAITGLVACMVNGSSQLDYIVAEPSGTATATISTVGFWMLTRGAGA